jgi:hypothetical protein
MAFVPQSCCTCWSIWLSSTADFSVDCVRTWFPGVVPFPLWEGGLGKVDVVVSTQGKWGKVLAGWQLLKAHVAHAMVGGVTDATDNCYLWVQRSPSPSAAKIPVPTALPQDVHYVVSNTVGGMACPKPSQVRLAKPQVLETRPGVYHGGRLLPLDHLKGQSVVQSIFTPSKRCQRCLNLSEFASAFDIPHQFVIQCSALELKSLLTYPS